jgi:hypothetical protein
MAAGDRDRFFLTRLPRRKNTNAWGGDRLVQFGADEASERSSESPRSVNQLFVSSGRGDAAAALETAQSALRFMRVPGLPMKAYIATEVGSHEQYLRRCVEEGVDSLVEKPVLAPMIGDIFEPSLIST